MITTSDAATNTVKAVLPPGACCQITLVDGKGARWVANVARLRAMDLDSANPSRGTKSRKQNTRKVQDKDSNLK
jgi:hypothetical protein